MESWFLILNESSYAIFFLIESNQRQDEGSCGWVTSTIRSPLNSITVLHRGHDLLSFSCSLRHGPQETVVRLRPLQHARNPSPSFPTSPVGLPVGLPVGFPVADLGGTLTFQPPQSLSNIGSICAHGFRTISDNLCIHLGVELLCLFVAIFSSFSSATRRL